MFDRQVCSSGDRWQSTRFVSLCCNGIDQPENEKALGPIPKPMATVVGFRLLLIWAFWSISTGWIGHKWPENIGRHGSKFVCMWSSSSAISRRPHHPQINNAKDNASYVVGISWVIQARTGCHRWTSTPLLNRFSHHVILASTIPDHSAYFFRVLKSEIHCRCSHTCTSCHKSSSIFSNFTLSSVLMPE